MTFSYGRLTAVGNVIPLGGAAAASSVYLVCARLWRSRRYRSQIERPYSETLTFTVNH